MKTYDQDGKNKLLCETNTFLPEIVFPGRRNSSCSMTKDQEFIN